MGLFYDLLCIVNCDVNVLILFAAIFSAIVFFGFIGFTFDLYRFVKINGSEKSNKKRKEAFYEARRRRERKLRMKFLQCIKYSIFGLGAVIVAYFFRFNEALYFILVFLVLSFVFWNLLFVRGIVRELIGYLQKDYSMMNLEFGSNRIKKFGEF